MDIMTAIFQYFPIFCIVLMRMSGFIITAPIFNSRNIPPHLKIFLSLALSAFVFLLIYPDHAVPAFDISFIILAVSEFLIGVVIGFSAQFLFAAIQLAGQSIDMQMGFGMVNVMDPQSGMQVPLMGTFKYLLAVLVFFLINGHHFLIEALIQSYSIVPLEGISITPSLISLLTDLTADIFLVAFKLAAPLIGALFISDFVMGIMARTVPQMNVFLVGMPAKIVAGFFLILVIIPLYVYLLSALFERCFKDTLQIIKVLV
ncbi:MAG: flagellar biosynthetic protein FliR [Peptococcaceae bacterium]